MSRKKGKSFGPVLVIIGLTIFVGILSLIFSIFGIDASKTIISSGTMETTLVTVKNIFSEDGLRFLIGDATSNFRMFEPLALLILALFGISICEKSGFLNALFSPLKRVKLNIIIFMTILLSIISTVIGDYSYIFLIPLTGALYKYLGKNPILGIMTVFLGVTLGYGAGIIFNYTDYSLSILTMEAAKADIDATFTYSLYSNFYIMFVSTIIISFILTILIDKFLVIRLAKRYIATEEEQELVVDKSAKKSSIIAGIIYLLIVIYLILPIKLPLAGALLDNDAARYIESLFGANSPFNNGLVIIIALQLMLCGYIYGKKSGNLKTGHDFSLALSMNFEKLGFMFVLMFFISLLIGVINWTNLGVVICSILVDLVGSMQLSGIILIVIFFISVILMSVFVPGAKEKWEIASPVVVPLFMQSNITPNFTQFIFKAADSVGKAITPVYVYYIIMLAFIEKYRTNERKQISIFGILKDILPIVLIMAIVWILIIVIWYVTALPIGINTYAVL